MWIHLLSLFIGLASLSAQPAETSNFRAAVPETTLLHAPLSNRGVTLWVHALRDTDTQSLISGSIEARYRDSRSNVAFSVQEGDGNVIVRFSSQSELARTPASAEVLQALIDDPGQYKLVFDNASATLERAESAVAMGYLPLTNLGSSADPFQVSLATSVTAIRSASGAAVLITCSMRSLNGRFMVTGMGLHAAGPASASGALISMREYSFGASTTSFFNPAAADFTVYVPVGEFDTPARAAVEGLFASPSEYSLSIQSENSGALVVLPLRSTEVQILRSRMTPYYRTGKLVDGAAESNGLISVHVMRGSNGRIAAAHLVFDSHLLLPETRSYSSFGLAENQGSFGFLCNTDMRFGTLLDSPNGGVYAHCNLLNSYLIERLLESPSEYVTALNTFSERPVSGEGTERLQGLVERK